jgi:hypothetical protein
VVFPSSDKPPGKHNQKRKGPASDNEERCHKNEEPPEEGWRLIGGWAKFPWRNNHKQPHGQMDQGDARKERCQTTDNIMENGQEFEVFAVRVLLLLVWRIIEHARKTS